MKNVIKWSGVVVLAGLGLAASARPLKFAQVLSDHTVLQRDIKVPVWGFGEPGAKVDVAMNGAPVGTAEVDATGRWEVRIPAQKANAKPSVLTAKSGAETAKISDVLFGDVWFGCGQSNMAYTFNGYGRNPIGGLEFVAKANDKLIRTLKMNVPGNGNAGIPRVDAGSNVTWRVSDPADPESVRNFSAALYWFGDKLQKDIGVPVGLVDASWGATKIDGWLDGDYCKAKAEGRARNIGGFWVDRREAFLKAGGAAGYEKAITAWNEKFNPGANCLPKAPAHKPGTPTLFDENFDDSGWATVTLPGTGFQHDPFPTNMHGEVWMRTKIVLTPEEARKNCAAYGVGDCYGQDMVYVNGRACGGSGNPNHGYGVGSKAGTNVIVVQLKLWPRDPKTGREGGMHKPPVFKVNGNRLIPLTTWKVCIPKQAPRPYLDNAPLDARAVNMFTATSMHNGLVRPLYPMGLRGVIWYQGCSDLGNGHYENFFTWLVNGWRANFTHGNRPLPVIITEIAPHKLDTKPDSVGRVKAGETAVPTWSVSADIRNALNELGEKMPDCATVSLLDLGEEDIHPVRKEEVGARWERLALAMAYGRTDVVPNGPVPVKIDWLGAKVVIHFKNANGLKTSDGKAVKGFELAGPVQTGLDKQDVSKAKPKEGYVYHYADAKIVGDTVELTAPGVTDAQSVRYAWFDLNIGWNLVNGANLPLGVLRRFKEGGYKTQVYEANK